VWYNQSRTLPLCFGSLQTKVSKGGIRVETSAMPNRNSKPGKLPAITARLLDNKIDMLRLELKQETANIRRELAEARTELNTKINETRTELNGKINELRAELRNEIADLKSENAREFSSIRNEIAMIRNEIADIKNTFRWNTVGIIAALLMGFAGIIAAIIIPQMILNHH